MSEPIKVYSRINGEPLILSSPSYARELLASGEYAAEPPVIVVTTEETGGEPKPEETGEPAPPTEEPAEKFVEEAPTDGSIDSSPVASGGNRRRNRRDAQPAN